MNRRVAAGIDISLHVVERLPGKEVGVKTARQVEYPWLRPPASEGR